MSLVTYVMSLGNHLEPFRSSLASFMEPVVRKKQKETLEKRLSNIWPYLLQSRRPARLDLIGASAKNCRTDFTPRNVNRKHFLAALFLINWKN